MSPEELTRFIIEEARRLGFHRVGVAPVEAPRRYPAYERWLERGCHGEMAYMAAPFHRAARRDPRELLAGARTAVVVALSYGRRGGEEVPASADGPRGFVARYARGADYHGVLKERLRRLASRVSEALGREVAARPCVDSAPLLERELAERAGVGFAAKNTMLIAPGLGSYIVLGELLLDARAAPTGADPDAADPARCGSCRACLDACPTGAFDGAHVLDARRCISYLTIEHKGIIPRELRAPIGQMIFGCDICQEVCPFNARAPDRTPADPELAPSEPDRGAPDLLALLELGTNQRKRYLEGTAMRRVNREQLLRNLCVALGNAGDRRAAPALERKLTDRSPIVRAHAAWALGRLGAPAPLEHRLPEEPDPLVREEIEAALSAPRPSSTRSCP